MTIKIQPVLPDRSKIELTEDAVARHWVKTLGASRKEIAAANASMGWKAHAVGRRKFYAFRPTGPVAAISVVYPGLANG